MTITVNFTDNSFSNLNITSWDWDFGDGTEHSSLQNPSHDYSIEGDYYVTLTIGDGTSTDSITKIVSAIIGVIDADFYYLVASGRVVQFYDTSFADTGIASWDWDFGDGSAHSSDQYPSHTYSSNGPFTVILTVTDNSSNIAYVQKVVAAGTVSYWEWEIDFTSSSEDGVLGIWYDAADWIASEVADYIINHSISFTDNVGGTFVAGVGFQRAASSGSLSFQWNFPALCDQPAISVYIGAYNTNGPLQKIGLTRYNSKNENMVPVYEFHSVHSPNIGTGQWGPGWWTFNAYAEDIRSNWLQTFMYSGTGTGITITISALKIGNYGHQVLI